MGFQNAILRHQLMVLMLIMLVAGGISRKTLAQVPVNELIFKGTHNSYQCHGNAPNMGHLLDQQIDDFGVWGLELDYGLAKVAGRTILVVGHDDGPGDGRCINIHDIYPDLDPNALTGYLRLIQRAKSFPYRPVVLFFDKKGWSEPCPFDCNRLVREATADVFGRSNVLSPEEARNKSVPELAGKVILGMNERQSGDCTNEEAVEVWFRNDPSINFFRIDQYQADWTFDVGVPPNPLIVDSTAASQSTVVESIGDDWFCITDLPGDSPNCSLFGIPATCDFSRGQIVHEQGTYRFPYRMIGRAVTRAQGLTPSADPLLLSRRRGHGWTVLIKPGNYPETLTINIPLTLKKDDRFAGTVVIGR